MLEFFENILPSILSKIWCITTKHYLDEHFNKFEPWVVQTIETKRSQSQGKKKVLFYTSNVINV